MKLPSCTLVVAALLSAVSCETPQPTGSTHFYTGSSDALPGEARETVQGMEQQVDQLRKQTASQLRQLQDKYTKMGKLDEAVAIRDVVRQLGGEAPTSSNTLPDPGSVGRYRGVVTHPLYFEVVGAIEGSLWGTDVYTDDSRLAVAVVHAGVLRIGEKGVVKVILMPGQATYNGSVRHGVMSNGYATYAGSFKVARP